MSDESAYRSMSTGYWIDTNSGPGFEDTREGFSPAAVVFAVQQLLTEKGIPVSTSPNMMYTASIAAADLLRALGVRPEIAPMR